MTNVPPGWYSDRWSGEQRWWDGQQWAPPRQQTSRHTAAKTAVGAAATIVAMFTIIVVAVAVSQPKPRPASPPGPVMLPPEVPAAVDPPPSSVAAQDPMSDRQAVDDPIVADVPATTVPAVVDGRKTFDGKGDGRTSAVEMAGGNYVVSYDFEGDCFHGGHLRRADGSLSGAKSLASGSGPMRGTDHIYGVKAGRYFVEMISGSAPGCPWQIVLTGTP